MKVTWTTRKLPTNWEEPWLKMVQKTAYFVKAYSIIHNYFVNIYHTCIDLIPTWDAYTWDVKDSKYIFVHGLDDKRHIIMSISSTVVGNLIHFQVVFMGTTTKCLYVHNVGRIDCEQARWHLTFSNNRSSDVETCKEYFINILQTYR